MDQPIFEIKNYRLQKAQNVAQVQKHHPLEKSQSNSSQYTLEGVNYNLSEQFGFLIRSVYIGDLLSSLAVVRYKGKEQLEKIQITLTISLESKNQEVTKKAFQIDDINSEIKLPFQLRIEALDSYIFVKPLHYNQANNPDPKPFVKGYRIQPKLPFKTDCRINPFLAPVYLLEYTFTNHSEAPVKFKKIDFKTDSPFESIKMVSANSDHCIQPEEKEKILFKVSVRPQQTQIYDDLLASLVGEKQINIGSIILEWGNFGVYVGPSVPLNISSNDISVEILNSDEDQQFQIEKLSELKLSINNLTGKPLQIKTFIKDDDMDGIKIMGVNQQNFKLMKQGQTHIITVYILPTMTGVQQLKGLIFINETNNQPIPFKNYLQLYIDNKFQSKIDFTQVQEQLIVMEMI